MGNGIAQVAARAGFQVVLRDVSNEFLQRGLAAIDKSLGRDVAKARLAEEEKRAILDRISATIEMESMHDAAVVIEAVTESFAVKAEVFRALDKITGPETMLASNTS